METTEPKDARVDFRLTTSQKELIARAAALSGLSVSDFISSTMVNASVKLLESHSHIIKLPVAEWNRFVEAISRDKGRKPTAAARKAAERYNKGRVVGDTYEW